MNLIEILLGFMQDPIMYSMIFFLYVILTVLILPIPVEIGLFNPYINPVILIFILALGKGIGSLLVFEIGTKVRDILSKRVIGIPLTKKIVECCERFVRKYGYYGLFIIMSIPLMLDSITVYLFSLLNTKNNGNRTMNRKWFFLINIAAGTIRGMIIILIAYFFSVKLV